MTFKEKLLNDRPDSVGDNFIGGCESCPISYGYEKKKPDFCPDKGGANVIEEVCEKCWNREIAFTKDMLVPGKHVVEIRKGDRYLVLTAKNYLCACGVGHMILEFHNVNLEYPYNHGFDIVKIYEILEHDALSGILDDVNLRLVWERVPKKMTITHDAVMEILKNKFPDFDEFEILNKG